MRITSFIACTFVAYLGMASLVEAQSGTEIVIPAGAFVKDYGGKVEESGGQAGMDMQHGAYRFPEDKGSALVGITTLLPADWVGEDIDVYFGGSCGGLCYEQFRIIGELEATGINTTTYLTSEDSGSTEVQVINDHEVLQRRFGIAIGRDPDHTDDTAAVTMNFEYLRIVCVTC